MGTTSENKVIENEKLPKDYDVFEDSDIRKDSIAFTMTREQLLELDRNERMQYIERVRIFHPEFNRLFKLIKKTYHENLIRGEPRNIFIEGGSGTGKTTLLKSIAKSYEGNVNTAFVIFKQRPRILSAGSSLLEGLGDPMYDRGEPPNMEKRIKSNVEKKRIMLILGDELQDLFDRDKYKVMYEVTNWLKCIIKELNIMVVFTGLTKQAWDIIKSNSQFRRLFIPKQIFEPFTYDPNIPETKTAFIKFLGKIESAFPLKEQSYLSGEEMSARMYAACYGRVGFLIPVLRQAALNALELNHEKITLRELADAFYQTAPIDVNNPFVGESPKFPLSPLRPDIATDIRKPNK
jgi:hypothetical protein